MHQPKKNYMNQIPNDNMVKIMIQDNKIYRKTTTKNMANINKNEYFIF